MDGVGNRILRQRKQQEAGEKVLKVAPQGTIQRHIKKLDLYPKVHRDRLKKQTLPGMVISVCVSAMILLMVVVEFYDYIWGMDAYHDTLSVDGGITDDVPINVNITFFDLPCNVVHLDTKDVSGEVRLDVSQNLLKSPVDRKGRISFAATHRHAPAAGGRAGSAAKNDPEGSEAGGTGDARYANDLNTLMKGYISARDPKSKDFCGPCEVIPMAYDQTMRKHAEGEKPRCCNTCDEVIEYHKEKKLTIPEKGDIEQCVHEASSANPGCNVAGTITVEKVKGSFSFSPGATMALGSQMLHFVSSNEAKEFNTSHVVNHLSFGDQAVKRFSVTDAPPLVHPLDGRGLYVPHDKLGHVKYIIHAIPVLYTTDTSAEEEGELVAHTTRANSFEISANSHLRLMPFNQRHAPSISFVYDFHPMQITHVYARPPFAHFLLNLCKVVGGVFAVTGVIDRVVGKVFATASA